MRYLLTAAITAAICFAVASGRGHAARQDNPTFKTMPDGVTAFFRSMDVACQVSGSYYGKAVICSNYSGGLQHARVFFTRGSLIVTRRIPSNVLLRTKR